MNKYVSCVLALVVIAAAVGAFFFYHSGVYETKVSGFDLKATLADTAGVSPHTHFILKTTEPLSPQVLEKYVKITPASDFSVQKVITSENTFEIVPKNDLASDRVYTIHVDKGPVADREFSWAYQVKAPFQVVSSIPGNKSTYAPINTGIEIGFNRENILNPERFITISPAVSGRFETIGSKVSFIPNQPLNERTVYTMKVAAGLKAEGTDDVLDSDTIIKFETAQSYSQKQEPTAYFSRHFSEFKPGSDIVLGLSAYNTSSVTASVYRFDSAQEFVDSAVKVRGDTPWARYYDSMTITDLPDSKRVFTGTLPLEGSDYTSTVRLPQDLPTGYYAMIISVGKGRDVAWFQMNSAASFAAFSGSESLLWLKDIETEKGLSGVPVSFDGKRVGQTGSDGVIVFDTPAELIRKPNDQYYSANQKFFVADIPSGTLVIPMEDEYGYSAGLNPIDSWWDYISLNKNIYLPTDTIRFWAIAKPRAKSDIGEEVSVKLTSPYWSSEEKDVVTYAETKAKISDYSAITGEMSFSNLKPGTYELTFRNGEETIAKQIVTVSAYIKPAYKITLASDKDSVFAGDSVTFKVKSEFFDGTPVANGFVTYRAYGVSTKDSEKTITLNAQGEGSFTLVPQYEASQTYWPSYLNVSVRSGKAEEGDIETSAMVFVFGPRIVNQITQKQIAHTATFTVQTRAVKLSDIPRGTPYWDTADYLGNPVSGATTRAEVFEVVYIKTQRGTGYDPINKLTYPIYDYRTEDHALATQPLMADRNGTAQMSFALTSGKTYKFVFTTYDETERAVKDVRYVYGGWDDSDYPVQDSYFTLYNPDAYKNYKIGEPINLQLQTYEGILPPERPTGFIFLISNNGKLEYQIQDSPKYISLFREKDIPNIGIWPGWFSGGRFHNTYLQNISFDANERRLNISVTKDKEIYKPGENVSLDFKITDKKGNPVRAEVNVSALDEAVFSMRPDEKDVINDLYKDTFSQVIVRSSNAPPYGGGGAEKGGGDGDSVRSDIQEMAIFKSITTDSRGLAHVEFKLPDNITSWRLTSQAITKDLYAGKDVRFIPVSLPLFVDATLNKTYLAGDELTLRLRAFGIAATGNIRYSAESPTLSFKNTSITGSDNVELPLGVLSLGTHDLTVSAIAGEYKDALKRPLKVLSSYFTKNASDFYGGVTGLKIQNDAIGYTTLVFSSAGKGRLYNELKSLSYQWGLRLDQKGTEFVATKLLNEYFGEDNKLPEFSDGKYQNYVGGLQLLPYGSEELELSAISAHVFDSSVFNRVTLQRYFSQTLDDAKSDIHRIVRALYGLTAFDIPLLSKIQRIKDDSSLTITDKVFVALALDSIGAKEEARTYYERAIAPSIVTKSSYAYIGGLKGDEMITTTALASGLAAGLSEPEASPLALYASQNYPKETLTTFERVLYIKAALPTLDSEEVGFDYSAGSKTGSRTLKDGESFKLVLSPEELKEFKLSSIKGKLGVTASYEKPSTPQSIVKDNNLSLDRIYEVNGVQTKEFKEGDVVTVKLTPHFETSALDDTYQIVDYVPSGLRPVDGNSEREYRDYDTHMSPVEVNDQKVTFILKTKLVLPIYYNARVISKGTYKAEPALMQAVHASDSATISHEDTITVK